MIAINLVEAVRSQLADFIGVELARNNTIAVHTPFIMDDGDRLGFYIVSRNDRWLITDHGDMVSRTAVFGRDLLGKGHVDRFNRLLSFYGLSHDQGVLQLESDTNDLGSSIRMFTQAAFEAIQLAKMPAEKTATTPRRKFKSELDRLIENAVPPDLVDHEWHHPKHDPDQVYPIDYRIRAHGPEWFVFGVEKAIKSLRSAVSILHYKQKRVSFRSLVIYQHKSDIADVATKPLDEVAIAQFASIEQRDEIKRYITDHILSGAI